jgi:hypothetical protein
MATYLISKKDTKQLETIVFNAEGGEAVAVFTDPKNAQQYIDDADWSEEFTVATLDAISFMEWLITCYRDGVLFMATNPRRSEQEAGMKVDSLNIEAQLTHAGQHINLVANPDF